jgi:hypothetical protein
MASSKQLIGMIRSHAAGDEDRFLAIAEHIASDAVRAGHHRMADEIRTLVGSLRELHADERPSARCPIASFPDRTLEAARRAPRAAPRAASARLMAARRHAARAATRLAS